MLLKTRPIRRCLFAYIYICKHIIIQGWYIMIRYRSYLRRSKRIKPNPLLLIVFAAFVGYIVIFAIISLLSIVSSKVSPDQSIMSIFTTAALFVGAFIGGYISAKNRHKNGLLMGVCCGRSACKVFHNRHCRGSRWSCGDKFLNIQINI